MPSFSTTTVNDIVDDLNRTHLLPAIQREFVWDSTQMLNLFDSIVRGYPIGSFLFWEVNGDFAKEQLKYKFVKNYVEEAIFPPDLEGVTYHNKRYLDEYENTPDKLSLILDGQQRLSTLYIGLKGTLTVRGFRKRRDNPESWSRTQLYLNVLSSPDKENNGRKYEFEFKEPEPVVTQNEYWYRVGDILNISEATQEANEIIEEVKKVEGITVEMIDNLRPIVQRNVGNLDMAINKESMIPYFTEKKENQNRVLDIFIRTNEGGTQLSKSDVLLSVATDHWQSDEKEIVARDVIGKFVDKMNKHPVRTGGSFSSNFVLRTLLTCANENMVFSLQNFSDPVLSNIKKVWINSRMQQSIMDTLDLVTSFGFTTSHIQSKSTLLPVIYWFYSNNILSLSWESKYGKRNRKRILFWLSAMVVTGEMNTGGTIQTVQAVRNVIRDTESNDFPLMKIESELHSYNKSMGFDEDTIERWIIDNNINNKKTRVFLSLLYFPDVADERNKYEVDHIFPRSKMNASTLIEEYGYALDEAEELSDLSRTVANLQLIQKTENRQKSSAVPDKWLATRTPEYRSRHYIPENKDLYSIENTKEFFERRKQMIKTELVGKTPDRSNLGPPIAEADAQ